MRKINPKILMDEELVQNGVTDEKFVENFVMDAKMDPKVVMDLSIFKFGGWNSLEGHSASSDQHMKKLSLREGLHVMMQCDMRQHFADRYWLHEHPGGYASRREPTMRKFKKESTTHCVKGLVCRWNIQKMRPESSEYVRKATGFFTNSWRIKMALESHFEEHAQEVWGTLRCILRC